MVSPNNVRKILFTLSAIFLGIAIYFGYKLDWFAEENFIDVSKLETIDELEEIQILPDRSTTVTFSDENENVHSLSYRYSINNFKVVVDTNNNVKHIFIEDNEGFYLQDEELFSALSVDEVVYELEAPTYKEKSKDKTYKIVSFPLKNGEVVESKKFVSTIKGIYKTFPTFSDELTNVVHVELLNKETNTVEEYFLSEKLGLVAFDNNSNTKKLLKEIQH